MATTQQNDSNSNISVLSSVHLNLGLGLGLDHWSFIWFRAFFKVYALLNSKLFKPLHKGMAETDVSHEFGREPGFSKVSFLQFLTLLVLICYTWRFHRDVS